MSGFNAGSIYYTVEAETAALLTADKQVQDFNQKAQDGFDKTDKKVNSLNSSMGKLTQIAKGVAAALVTNQVFGYANAWNDLEDRLKNTGLASLELKNVQEQLMDTSNRNGRTIEESAELYIRLSNSMKEMGYSTQGTLSYIDTLSNLMTINKTETMKAEAAINALTKAQMKGKLSGDEALSVFNAMPSILKTLGNRLNKTEQEVRKMATDGKLSMKDFNQAMIDSQAETAALADNMRNNLGDATNHFTNKLKQALGQLDSTTGATQTLVSGIKLLAENMNVVVGSAGILSAVLAGQYLSSLTAATKAKISSALASYNSAKAIRNEANEELKSLEIKGKVLTAERNALIAEQQVTTSKQRRIAIERELSIIQAKRTALTNQETAAQTRLAAVTKASTFAVNGLKSAMNFLGGPAGILLIAAGALMTWASNAAEAKRSALELTDEIAALTEKFKGMSKVQREAFATDLKAKIMSQTDAIQKQEDKIENLIEKQKLVSQGYGKKYGNNEAERIAAIQKEIESEEKLLAVMNEGRNKAMDLLDEVIVTNYEAVESIDKVTESTKKLNDEFKKETVNNLPKKIADLSTQLDIAELKQKGFNEQAFIYQTVLSALGDEAGKYKTALLGLIQGTADMTDLTDEQIKLLQPLIDKSRNLYKISKDGSKSYAEELKKLNKDLNLLSASYSQTSAETQILALEQETKTKVIGKQREALAKLFNLMDGYKSLAKIENPLTVEKDFYNNAKAALDDWEAKNKDRLAKDKDLRAKHYEKVEKLEQDHQIRMAEIKANTAVSDVDKAVAQVDPIQALANENERKLAIIQEYENNKWLTEQQALALREAANTQYEQNRIAAQWEIWRNQNEANQLLASSLDGLSSSATSTISGLMSGTMNATDAMKNFANVILNEAVGSLVKMGMQQVQNAIMGQALSQSTTAIQLANAAELAAAYTPAAIQASIATEGAAAATGQAAYLAAMGTMQSAALASFGGGRLTGGIVDANKFYRVNESGQPEMLVSGGKQYMLPNKNGEVVPANKLTGSSGGKSVTITINQSIVFEGEQSGQESANQTAQMLKQAIKRVLQDEKRPGGMFNNR